MREEIDTAIQLILLITIAMYVSSLLASAYRQIVYVYGFLALLSALLLICDITYYAFRNRLYRFRERISVPIILASIMLFTLGFICLNPKMTLSIVLQQIPYAKPSTVYIETIPHIAILLLMLTSLMLSTHIRLNYEEKLRKAVRENMRRMGR